MYKKLIVLTGLMLCFVGTAAAQDRIHWMSMDEALAAQKKNPKKIMLDAYTNWCGPCKMMDQKTYTNQDLVHYVNEHYYAVKFNAEGNDTIHYHGYTYTNPKYDPNRKNKKNYQHLFAYYLKINAYPTVVFFDEESNYIAPVVGYRKPRNLEVYLKMIASDDYKEVTTKEKWKAYQKDFKHTFDK